MLPLFREMGNHLWGVVLAGGGGVRLKALARRICGDDRPKQYVAVLGDRTLLRQTLDRVALGIPSVRTAVVTLRSHAPYFAEQWAGPAPPHMLVQPADRGTAAGILLPVHWIARQDPGATVAVFPSDHFVSEPAMFMAHIVQIAAWVDEHPDRLVLLGAYATGPEVEYGWIELGIPLDSTDDRRVWEVRRFWEKPSEEKARVCLEAGCLWNTFILVGKAASPGLYFDAQSQFFPRGPRAVSTVPGGSGDAASGVVRPRNPSTGIRGCRERPGPAGVGSRVGPRRVMTIT